MSNTLPANVHISPHPCLQVKLSQLREATANSRETKALVHEISLIVACEAFAKGLSTKEGPKVSIHPSTSFLNSHFHLYSQPPPLFPLPLIHKKQVKKKPTLTRHKQSKTHLGYEYTTTTLSSPSISLVPILRSGLSMIPAIETLLPSPVPTHHLGLFREPTTLQPVEYYNNLPYHIPSAPLPSNTANSSASQLAILVDPVIATGGTAVAAIQTLREWGVQRIIVIGILGAVEGVRKAAGEWSEGTEIWLAGLDEDVNEKGMIKPGVGDVGDRLFLTIGK